MGDRETLAKAKKELEELYMGVPDDSVNLTFQDFAQVRPNKKLSPSSTMEPIQEKPYKFTPPSSPLVKLPSLDFSKGLEVSFPIHHHQHRPEEGGVLGRDDHYGQHQVPDHGGDQRSTVFDDMSHASGYGVERGRRRRPGIPHSNICAICSNYIYICGHRCLVCGRIYCRQCVSDGMGEMLEGRKCIDCLGRRFSQRYIHKAGKVGLCMGYPSLMKQQELKWAERGPRHTGNSTVSVMTSRSRSPVTHQHTPTVASRSRSPVGLATPTRQLHSPTNLDTPSFVINSPYSPYNPTNHHPMPF